MGLFRMFAGKPPEGHEDKGDACFRNGAFGDARIEFEKALHKIETRYPEKKHLADRIAKKHKEASEALALVHVENARALAEAGDLNQAAELYGLARDLTGRAATLEKIEQGLHLLADRQVEARQPARPDLSGTETEPPAFDDETGFDGDDEELFSVLCHALPEETARAYQSYGDAFARGYIALNQGDFSTAVTELSRALEDHNGNAPLIALELATACLHADRHDRARDLLETCLAQNPLEIRAYELLCEMYWEKGRHQEALDLLASVPEAIQDSPDIQMLAGETFFQAGDLEKARAAFQAYAEVNGSDEIVSRALAKTFEAAGQVEQARDMYAQAMNQCVSCQKRIDPFLKQRFAELSYQSGETSTKLLDLFFSLVQEDPDHRGLYYLRIGRLYEKRGESGQAARYLGLAGQMGQQA